jgi:hypothetical protein
VHRENLVTGGNSERLTNIKLEINVLDGVSTYSDQSTAGSFGLELLLKAKEIVHIRYYRKTPILTFVANTRSQSCILEVIRISQTILLRTNLPQSGILYYKQHLLKSGSVK